MGQNFFLNHSNAFKTASRDLPDTLKTSTLGPTIFCYKNISGPKIISETLKTSFRHPADPFQVASTHLPDTLKTPSKDLPDTFHISSCQPRDTKHSSPRHPKLGVEYKIHMVGWVVFFQEIIPLRGSILQVGSCQILSLAENP